MQWNCYQPTNVSEEWNEQDCHYLEPFFTNINGAVHVMRNVPPEIAGALCSRTSRVNGSLLRVFLDEFVYPVSQGEDKGFAAELAEYTALLHRYGFKTPLGNKRAQQLYAKWSAAYGDESIKQVAGTYLVFPGISQVAIKNLEDRRIGLAPIEQSTRFVNFGQRINGRHRYYTDPDFANCGLDREYRETMDYLFDRYIHAVAVLKESLARRFPNEKRTVIEKKAFDIARGFLPMATLGQVMFYGNAQAFEYMINNSAAHCLGELRWIGHASAVELRKEIESMLLRLDDPKNAEYQEYLCLRGERMRNLLGNSMPLWCLKNDYYANCGIQAPRVKLIDYDSDGEAKVVAAALFPSSDANWGELLTCVKRMSPEQKLAVLQRYLEGRRDGERWKKVGRAFENASVCFEIIMNAGAYRDLHRHRMHTQERQLFTIWHGYDVPEEMEDAGIHGMIHEADRRIYNLFYRIERALGPEHAQYATMLYHRVRFYQRQNVRQAFWEIELRTSPQGHPDYRRVEQEKFRLLKQVYPVLTAFMQADMNEYDFARRGIEDRQRAKEKWIAGKLQSELA